MKAETTGSDTAAKLRRRAVREGFAYVESAIPTSSAGKALLVNEKARSFTCVVGNPLGVYCPRDWWTPRAKERSMALAARWTDSEMWNWPTRAGLLNECMMETLCKCYFEKRVIQTTKNALSPWK